MKKISYIGISILFIGFLLMTGCSSAAKNQEKITSLQEEVTSLRKEVSNLKAENGDLKAKLDRNATDEVTVYFIKSAPTEFYLVPQKRKVAAGGDLLRKALEELVKGPYVNGGLDPALPKGSKLLDVRVEGERAVVDFNAATQKNLNVGSSVEALVIAAIVNTATEFPNIKEVQILIEGKKVESLAGHIEATKPFTRNEKVIRTTP